MWKRSGFAFVLLAVAAGMLIAPQGATAQETYGTAMKLAEQHALAWLREQQVPNRRVPDPQPERRNLILSYRIPEDDPAYRYLYGRSYVYDCAIAAIAFTMAEDFSTAESILLALRRQLLPDGGLWFGMNTQNSWPSQDDSSGALVRSGATAWAGYAATYYLRTRLAGNSRFLQTDRVAPRILQLATAVGTYLLNRQVTDNTDRRYGLITGGMGSYSYKFHDGQVTALYDANPITWASTEHNLDCYFLLADLYFLTRDRRYKEASRAVLTGLVSLWDPDAGQLLQGVKGDGTVDSLLPLDTASWGSMLLRAVGSTGRANTALRTAQQKFQLDGSGNYKPYASGKLYQSDGVAQYYFDTPDESWEDMDLAWVEGALGVAAALAKAGDRDEAEKILDAALAFEVDGGLRYASREIPHQFTTYPSVASTAWFVIAYHVARTSTARLLFWEVP